MSPTIPTMALANSTQICSLGAIPYPVVPSAKILGMTAAQVRNYSTSTSEHWDALSTELNDVNACNITVTYTHSGWNDTINVETWLPLSGWNGRFQGGSGGGWVTGHTDGLPLRASQGYAVSVTDGGHSPDSNTKDWALKGDGSVNQPLLEDFASLALHELAVIGKAITESFYGKPPAYSYWNGCSTGGRQGLMLAQRYPDDFDGIMAAAPAINWPTFITAEYWPQFLMNQMGVYPETCEFDAIRNAAIDACDDLDGVKDKILSAPGLCHFDPFSVVGQPYDCQGSLRTITKEAAMLAQQIWRGPVGPNNSSRWYGLNHDASLSMLSGVTCEDHSGVRQCTGSPFDISADWLQLYVINDVDFDLTTLSSEQYDALFEEAISKYQDVIGTANPDLSGFRTKGGKMITWHGLADEAIFPNGTSNYYQKVLELDPAAREFYRYFEAPGVTHCSEEDSSGPYPQDVLESLIAWVEHGQAPETLKAELRDPESQSAVLRRDLCQWPLVARFVGGDTTQASSFGCDAHF